ncbi:hypothetical protein KDAU_62930 [Dictyobacter aurantiacus]|uniref:Uncharacterized protein n=1 Tax=Dictyobacter aurantiacus TaxID=1936993 RepID=A0A401ZQA5_9CHLR|nr:hypothetical protein KDAU_62930 [Dictyobacter aurantiacus]
MSVRVCLTLVTIGARERPRTRVHYVAALVLCVGACSAHPRTACTNTQRTREHRRCECSGVPQAMIMSVRHVLRVCLTLVSLGACALPRTRGRSAAVLVFIYWCIGCANAHPMHQ